MGKATTSAVVKALLRQPDIGDDDCCPSSVRANVRMLLMVIGMKIEGPK